MCIRDRSTQSTGALRIRTMVSKARFGASYGVKHKGGYGTDYRKWDRIIDSDSDDEAPSSARPASKEPPMDENDKRLLQAAQLTQQAQMRGDATGMEAAMRMAQSALRAKGVPEEEVQKVLAQERSRQAGEPMPPPPKPSAPLNVEAAKGNMQSALSSANAQLQRIEEQQERLATMSSPEDLFAFMVEQGMDQEQIQRMMNGDTSVVEQFVQGQDTVTTETNQTMSEVEVLAAQIKELSATKSSLLNEQNAAMAKLEEHKKQHEKQRANLDEAEAQKRQVESQLKQAEKLMAEERLPGQAEHFLTHSADGREITVTVLLPGIRSVGEVDLDLEGSEMVVEAGEHELRLQLPAVNQDEIKAKFIKETATLVVTLKLIKS
eukprot:TRINITY_DN20345_c0_g1_i3.p1 TRINITY_DN20345_c0_g1~~TRINITY_DN20345_c0_g1_i3.p1  ORF type:complete len:378 (-),score=109.16 TRINITY_DN20345_c0_g1_i3:346-1479(-)